MSIGEYVFLGMFFLLYLGIPALLAWATYCDNCKIDLRDLWMHQGKADKLAVIILGTWWIHSCSMILWTLTKSIQTADYITYMGWALPIIAKMWAPQNPPPTQPPNT